MAIQKLILSFLILAATPSFADTLVTFDANRVTCYEFQPMKVASVNDDDHETTLQKWCYHSGQASSDPLFVFNADRPKISSELSFTVDIDGFMTHGSLLSGQITFHKVKASEFNPFSVPYKEPKNLKKIPTPEISLESAEAVLKTLTQSIFLKPSSFILNEGHYAAFQQAETLPWRGFWWPYKTQRLSKSPTSPFAKYDKYVQNKTGAASIAQAWENANHKYNGVWWEGHCNGWASSSILRPEPRVSKKDPVSGVTFSVADQKGILSETDYCAVTSFYGKRNRNRAGDDSRDIYPALFHKTLTYYIGKLRKPVIIDYRSDPAVDNHPVSGYQMSIKKINDSSFEVTAILNFHRYDNRPNFPPGIAPLYTRTYKYTLNYNALGEITGGVWLSKNPDFMWVPLGIRDCGSNNPHISHEITQEILNLPSVAGSPIVIFDEDRDSGNRYVLTHGN